MIAIVDFSHVVPGEIVAISINPDFTGKGYGSQKAKATYLRWGRDTVGWAIYLFRRRTV